MTKTEKTLCKSFFNIPVPKAFLDATEKILINEYFKGKCQTLIDDGFVDSESFEKMTELKNYIANEIDFDDSDNVIYFDLLRLFLAITRKYIK